MIGVLAGVEVRVKEHPPSTALSSELSALIISRLSEN